MNIKEINIKNKQNRTKSNDDIRFRSEIELTKKICVRFRSMTEQNRIQSFDLVRFSSI